jgi:hypothetical protein
LKKMNKDMDGGTLGIVMTSEGTKETEENF